MVVVSLFAVPLLALVAAAYVAIRGLLSPQKTLAFRRADIQSLADGDLVLAEAVEVKRMFIRTYGRGAQYLRTSAITARLHPSSKPFTRTMSSGSPDRGQDPRGRLHS
jgi:hypothetical protein